MMQRHRFLEALHGRNTGRPPVWLMRQAGRYMPEYRAIRSKHSFLEMCHQPELIVEVTKLPLKAFQMDAAILFSDILMIPEALEVGLRFDDGVGPVIERPLRSINDVRNLPAIDAKEKLQFVAKGISLLKKEIDVPLIGFCGAPFTVASYMIEGGSSKTLKKTKEWMLRDPEGFHALLDKIADHSIHYLQMQIDAGVDAVQIFDSWANYLGHRQFREFSWGYLQKILQGLKRPTPTLLFCRGSSVFAPDLAQLKPNAISLDWNANLDAMRKVIPQSIALQGNLDPDILYASKETIQREVRHLLDQRKGDPAYIFNLGHGISPDMPYENVRTLVQTVQTYI